MNCLDAHLCVVVCHLFPVYSSMGEVYFCLHVQNCSDSCINKSINIGQCLWVRANKNASLVDFIVRHTAYKICIGLVNGSIYDKSLV